MKYIYLSLLVITVFLSILPSTASCQNPTETAKIEGEELIRKNLSENQPNKVNGKEYTLWISNPGNDNWTLSVNPAEAFQITQLEKNKWKVKIINADILYTEIAPNQFVPKPLSFSITKTAPISPSTSGTGVTECVFNVHFSLLNGETIKINSLFKGVTYSLEYDENIVRDLGQTGNLHTFLRLKKGRAYVVCVIKENDQEVLRSDKVEIPECLVSSEEELPKADDHTKPPITDPVKPVPKDDHTKSPITDLVNATCDLCKGKGEITIFETRQSSVTIFIGNKVRPLFVDARNKSNKIQYSDESNYGGFLKIGDNDCKWKYTSKGTDITMPPHMTIGMEDNYGIKTTPKYNFLVNSHFICPRCNGKGFLLKKTTNINVEK